MSDDDDHHEGKKQEYKEELSPELLALREQWAIEQDAIAKKVSTDDNTAGFAMPWEDAAVVKKPILSLVGGVDISFVKDTSLAVASLVVLNFPSMTVRRHLIHHCEMKLPYMPGFLAFREVAPLQFLMDKFRKDFPEDVPQIIFVDGNGVLHPRHCGLASHFGVVCDVPCVGSAKKLLSVDGLSRDSIKAQFAAMSKDQKKELLPLKGTSGHIWGYAALTGNSSTQPIYISTGHRISPLSAAKLVQVMCPNRVPEPIRQADLQSREYLRQHGGDVDPNSGTSHEVAPHSIPNSVPRAKKDEKADA